MLCYWDASPGAGWRGTNISTEAFLGAIDPTYWVPLFRVPGWRLELQRCDFFHAFLLGIALCTNADILWELLEIGHFGDARLARETLMSSATYSFKVWLLRKGFSIMGCLH